MSISSCFPRIISAVMFYPCEKLMKLTKKSFSRGHDQASALGAHAHSKSIADKGHFVVYTVDGRRFMVPLEYLHCHIFQQLFKMSEDVFGLPRDGPIKLPCDTVFMEYIFSFLQKRASEDVKNGLFNCIATCGWCSDPSHLCLQAQNQQMLLHGC